MQNDCLRNNRCSFCEPYIVHKYTIYEKEQRFNVKGCGEHNNH